ncbi:uncharacterized protein DUF742 [Actinocorallia herbida]|uniref:Uncharacterized protein DUF742 n=1 Tax=Actinocorallia herbida TaxID=58109 RepID=A0A3N1D4C1_9ACTN|nr:DUF742 domain-containing protein [Actinocorallia herbida]ROO87928.1 uncharacterized protein DUF742 [Actinocorallia herbida]
MDPPEEHWLEEDSGPIVRPFAVVQGRIPSTGDLFDLITVVRATGLAGDPSLLEPEHMAILRRCARPIPVVDLSYELNLPLGVMRVLLGDLRTQGLISTGAPPSRHGRPGNDLLREVISGLRRL